ncbi:MAG: fimbrillin family protein [Paramuribaculum sp.]|nr:fimbrillin family protein [Paramuribaculum sp.]
MHSIKIWSLAFTVAASGLLIGSCSGSEDEPTVPEETGTPMTFNAVESESRAAVSAAGFNATGTEIKVWGVYYNPEKPGYFNLFDGTTVKREETGWTYSPQRYWMPGYTYDFRALYPANLSASAKVEYVKGNGATSHIKIDGFTADGTDLMVASERRIALADNDKSLAAVDLRFRHILSRVTFIAKTDDTEPFKILGFRIKNVAASGNWDGSTYKADGSDYGKWTPGESNGSYTAAIPSGGLSVGNTPVRLFDGDNIILAVPQPFESLAIEIEYSYPDDARIHSAAAQLSGTWLPGKSYSYSFTINPQILFEAPVVDDWSSESVNSPDFDVKLP